MVDVNFETPDFIDDAVEEAENWEYLYQVEASLRKSNRAFIWDNMIKKDEDAKELIKTVLANNRAAKREEERVTRIVIRQILKPNFRLEKRIDKRSGKEIKQIRNTKTGRYESRKKAYKNL